MAFTTTHTVRFQHCDPAEIVFYPRYYEMLNATIEEWFDTRLVWSFAEIHGPMDRGVPTVAHETVFLKPSRLGERLDFTLTPTHIGGSSVKLLVEVTCDGEPRVRFNTTLVWFAKSDGRPRPWPDELRAGMTREMTLETEGDAR
ncbi:4-hydroxybenzoyl-CoA thioesterase [Amaricoccus macauensis]|uniref:4-hydroxybenzoyl-CoA thioesterase n=1 Tax=Amaricoccus macauensis TaxID=57001 RepID=A0A840SK55_9RHOB|nr:thioesterase family protein [Amaricoccus macauensis]MBB5222317.1 4-hydroxybenzoyl-CoA thioesterase [Amaricoccus macauensis]